MIDLTLDVETIHLAKDVEGGWKNVYGFGLACAVIDHSKLHTPIIYTEDQRERLQAALLSCDRITGWNIWAFDYKVIWEHPPWELLAKKTNDLYRRCHVAMGLDPEGFGYHHTRWGLNRVAMNTLGQGKSGSGICAPALYAAGNIEELHEYCSRDVAITKRLSVLVDAGKPLSNGKSDILLLDDPMWDDCTKAVARVES